MRVALVTGGARRIGAALVKKLHAANYNVVIHYHQSERDAQILANSLLKNRPGSVFLLKQNLLEKDAALLIIEQVINWKGRLDLIINNASVFYKTLLPSLLLEKSQKAIDQTLGETTLAAWNEEYDRMFQVNAKFPFLLSMLAYPYLKETKGSIINITDTHTDRPLKEYAIYCQSKAALQLQTKALAREFAPDVRVNAIAPGAIAWPEHENALSDEKKAAILAATPLKRHGSPENIACAVMTFVNHDFITGQILAVDGGKSLKGG